MSFVLETVKILRDGQEVIINKSDFDKDKHVLATADKDKVYKSKHKPTKSK